MVWAWGGPQEHGFVFVPAFYQRSDHSGVSALLPLFWSSYDTNEAHFWLAGYWRAHTGSTDSLALYPFFATKKTGKDTEELSILWPIYKREETVKDDGTLAHRYRRFLAFSDDARPGHHELSLFGFVVRESTD
jgi:hypothetical protein